MRFNDIMYLQCIYDELILDGQGNKKIVKMGNSLGITIPAAFLHKLNLLQGTSVDLELLEGKILITRSLPDEPALPLSESAVLDLLEKRTS